MRGSLLLAAVAALFGVSTQASAAFYLTDSDLAYLAALNLEMSNSIINELGPKEEATLHAAINDSTTADRPSDRAKIVRDTLAEFISHRRWEETHPGRYWGDR
jgi:hypothetical protein